MSKAEKISLIIDSICRELGIEYCSSNPHYISLVEDAQKLGNLYLDLKIIAGELQMISERHNINELNRLLQDDIIKIENIEHDIIKIARSIKDDSTIEGQT